MSVPGEVQTGRRDARKLCESCKVRIRVGELRTSEIWPQRLLLTEEQLNLILLAAGEFDRLTDEAGEPETAVAFVDWLRPSALNAGDEPTIRVDTQRRGVAA